MSTETSSNKKRKRADSLSQSDEVTLSIYDKSPSAVGPVLASFPAIQPPKATAFTVYEPPHLQNITTPGQDLDGTEFVQRPVVVAGETDAVEFYSTGESEALRGGCRYLIGIHNKRTNTVLLRAAPLQILGRRVKALKHLSSVSDTNTGADRTEQRAALGDVFGTKKAQKAIRAAERNKVDVSAMEGVVGHIQDSVESGTRGLPTQDEAKSISDSTRQIPPFDASATRPEDVYKLSAIVPDAELGAIPIKDILGAGSHEERMRCVPMPAPFAAQSEWLAQHVRMVFENAREGGKPSKRKLRILMYTACLLTFRFSAPRFCRERYALEQRLPGIPSIVIDGIYARFSETVRGSSEAKFTSDNAVRLLSYIFALCLHLDDFATDTTLLAADLREPVTKINQHFKLLGCKIEKLGTAELSRRGLNAVTADHKRAVLRVPLEFAKGKFRRR